MNLEKSPTIEQLSELLRECDDHAGHHVLWVAKNGDVHVSRVPKDRTPVGFQMGEPDMQLRFETFEAGNDYVGADAAKDQIWVKQLFGTLIKDWPTAKSKPTVEYIDQF